MGTYLRIDRVALTMGELHILCAVDMMSLDSISELARAVGKDRGALYRIIKSLADRGYVSRSILPGRAGRRTSIRITEQGRALRLEAFGVLFGDLADIDADG